MLTLLHDSPFSKGYTGKIFNISVDLVLKKFRPNTIIRVIKPVKGDPRITIKLRPTFSYGWGEPERTRGSNHIRYLLANQTIRLTTNVSITYILNEVTFHLDEPIYLILMPDESLTIGPSEYAFDSFEKTTQYWEQWASSLNIPMEWQKDVIRSSIILKILSFEETGAITSSITTSIPQTVDGPNLDHRYCYIRDAMMSIRALNLINATNVMTDFLRFISNILSSHKETIQPVYGIGLEQRLTEKIIHRLPGFRGLSPVIKGTNDHKKLKNDVYGNIILSFTHFFFDTRHSEEGASKLYQKLERLGEMCVNLAVSQDHFDDEKEENEAPEVHTLSSVVCWAGCDRLAKICKLIGSPREEYWMSNAKTIKEMILNRAWNEELGSFTSTFRGKEISAHLLLMFKLGFSDNHDDRFSRTLQMIETRLMKFGIGIAVKETDTTCDFLATFVYISVIGLIEGRQTEAREMLERVVKIGCNGVFSEKFDPITLEMWGNYPYGPAQAGLIECTNALSKDWSSI